MFGGFGNFGVFGVFVCWQTVGLKAYRKLLLWPWPWAACSGSGPGPGVLAGNGIWRVWKVLAIWNVCRRANSSFESP